MFNRVDLRVIGAKGPKPGESSAGLVLPAQIDSVNMIAKALHVPMAFAPIAMPPEATGISVSLDRRGVVAKKDHHLFSLFVDISLDGGTTWGGAHVDQSAGQVPMCFSMGDAITTGLDEGADASQTVTLPPDQGSGRLVRISAGAKAAVDVGVYYQILTDPIERRQLLKDVHHSVAFDAASGVKLATAVTSTNWTHTNVGTSNLFASVGVAFTATIVHYTNPTCTYNSVSMGVAVSQTNATFAASVNEGQAKCFGKINPTTGTQTVVITWTDTIIRSVSGSQTYTGVNQTTAIGNTATGSNVGADATDNGNPSVSSATGNMVADAMVVDINAGTIVAGQTSRWKNGATVSNHGGGGQDAAGAASVTMGWSWPTAKQYATAAFEILAAAAATSKVPVIGMHRAQQAA